MSNENAVIGMLRAIDKSAPEVSEAIQLLVADVYKVYNELFPASSNIRSPVGTISKDLTPVTNFVLTFYPTNLRLTWDLGNAFRYELRIGSTWDTAIPVLTTSSNVANLDPVFLNLVEGNYTFLIRAVDINGLYGVTITSVDFTIGETTAPLLSIQVVANSVLLSWTIPDSIWQIDHYKIYKDSVEIGQIKGNFKVQVELAAGIYTYSVSAVDIVGNEGTLSNAFTVNVNSPLDFSVVDSIDAVYTGIFTDTEKITRLGSQGVIGAVNLETWRQHFVNNAWTTIRQQYNAGYTLYFQPSDPGGSYREVFDFGLTLSNVNISIVYDKITLSGTCSVTTDIEYSLDNITYSAPFTGSSLFVVSFRYIRVTWNFVNTDDKSGAFISNLKVVGDIQLTTDSSNTSILAADAGGTELFYNLTFKQVNSVTATAINANLITVVVVSFTKTSFFVKAFNAAGARTNANISWKSRGII